MLEYIADLVTEARLSDDILTWADITNKTNKEFGETITSNA